MNVHQFFESDFDRSLIENLIQKKIKTCQFLLFHKRRIVSNIYLQNDAFFNILTPTSFFVFEM